jgi:hypothetical protein
VTSGVSFDDGSMTEGKGGRRRGIIGRIVMGTEGTDESGTRTLVIGGSVVAVLGFGWFALSHYVLGTALGDAVVESLGVVLALLVVASVIGAVRGAMRERRRGGGEGPPTG